MLKIESKPGFADGSQESVYRYISDFRNFANLLPSERFRNLEITAETVRFSIDGLGSVGLRFAGRTPFSQIVVTGTEDSSADFTFWFNISVISENRSQVNLILQTNLNLFLEMMAKGPLQQFADLIADRLGDIKFS